MTQTREQPRDQQTGVQAEREPRLDAELILDLDLPSQDVDLLRGGPCSKSNKG